MNDKLDTRITDYALGELDEPSLAEMREQLASDAAARSEAAEIAQLAGAMRRATVRPHATVEERNALLQDILQAHLETQAERAAAEAAVEKVVLPATSTWRSRVWIYGGAAIAASVLLIGMTQFAVWRVVQNAKVSSDMAAVVPEAVTSGANNSSAENGMQYRHEKLLRRSSVSGLSDSGSPIWIAQKESGSTKPVNPLGLTTQQPNAPPFTKSGAGALDAPARDASRQGAAPAGVVAGPATPNSAPGAAESKPALAMKAAPDAGALKKFPSLGPGPAVHSPAPASPLIENGRIATIAEPAPPKTPVASEDQFIALLLERRRMAAMYGISHPKTKELDARIRTEQARYDEQRRAEAAAQQERFNTEAYDSIVENSFQRTMDTPLSTFSIDVDTASYSNVRRFLTQGRLPPRGAVRIEEFLNYFTYNYPQPKGTDPFSITTEAVRCPWNAQNVLVRVGLKGRTIPVQERPSTNLVFLVDVSGSMQTADKLPLVRESLKMLVRELGDNDRVAIVVYAGSTGLVLPSTGGHEKQKILDAIGKLEAGGSTNGGAGIQLAYEIAVQNFIKGGVNRVVLATDGDFNVGVTNRSELVDLIEKKAKTGVFFSGLAYGTGNLKDATLEQLADKGNGNYAYIDSLAEARKVLVEQMSATLVTIAKDVKVQIEFNPARVEAYRLIGYENRVLAAQDFNDDKKDAGEIGAGHTVTALYEIVPVGLTAVDVNIGLPPAIDPLKYQKPQPKPKLQATEASKANELLTLKLRYKQPDGDESKLIERPLKNEIKDYAKASGDFKFAAAVASFGMQLRDSQYRGTATLDAVLELAQAGIGRDEGGYRREFIELVRKARELKPQSTQP
jgi:Ca-activated chloride channel family protein